MNIPLSQILANTQNLNGRVIRYGVLTLEADGVVTHRAKYQGNISIVKNRRLEADGTTATKVLSIFPFLNRV